MSNGKEVTEDVDLMNKFLGGDSDAKTDPPNTESPGTNPPPTEPPSTQAPSTQAPSTDSPATQAPSTDAPTTDAPSEADEELKRLRDEVEELKKARTPKTSAPTTEAPIEEVNFLDGVDFDEIRDDPAKLNELLNKVHKGAVRSTRATVRESVPGMAANTVQQVLLAKSMSDRFYETNDDLKSHNEEVGKVFGELQTKDPKQSYDNLMEATAVEVRKRLNLPEKGGKKGNVKEGKKNNPPPLPGKRGGSGRPGSESSKNSVQSQLEDMNKSLGR